MPKPSFRESKNKLRYPLAFCHYIHNKYFPYIYYTRKTFSLTVIQLLFYTLLYVQFKMDALKFIGLVFSLHLLIYISKEWATQGILFPNQKERKKITSRKHVTASRVEESISYIDSFKEIEKEKLDDFRTSILDIMKSNLESYFHISPGEERKISVALIVPSPSVPAQQYDVVSRDSESLRTRKLRTIKGDESHLYKSVDAILKNSIALTDEVSVEFKDLDVKPYKSVMAFPLLWSTYDKNAEEVLFSFGSISIDFTNRYRFNGAEEEIESNLRPYYKLLLFSFPSEVHEVDATIKGGEEYVRTGNSQS